jgi:hypothetical protein
MKVIQFAPEKGKSAQNRIRDPHGWLASGLRQIAAAEDAEARAATIEKLNLRLAERGRSFRDLAELVERVGFDAGDETLEPDCPFTADSLRELYRRYGSTRQFLPHLLWCGDALRRLRSGQEPTLADRRQRAELLAKLRGALR